MQNSLLKLFMIILGSIIAGGFLFLLLFATFTIRW